MSIWRMDSLAQSNPLEHAHIHTHTRARLTQSQTILLHPCTHSHSQTEQFMMMHRPEILTKYGDEFKIGVVQGSAKL
jgi:hypothetical protein